MMRRARGVDDRGVQGLDLILVAAFLEQTQNHHHFLSTSSHPAEHAQRSTLRPCPRQANATRGWRVDTINRPRTAVE